MQAFLLAAKWQAPTLVALDEVASADVPRSSVTGVQAQLLDTYEALPAGAGAREGSLRHAQPWPAQIVVSGKSKSPNAAAVAVAAPVGPASSPKLALENPGAAAEPGAPGGAGGARTPPPPQSPPALPAPARRSPPPSPSPSPSPPFENERGQVVPVDRELAFFRCAPQLSGQQRLTMLVALASDVARTVVVSIFVLARHAWAGKRVHREDVVALLGEPCSLSLGGKLVDKLCCWLHANRRAVDSFKLANESLLEAAFLRTYAYWPLLAIQLHAEVDASDESQIQQALQGGRCAFPTSTCVAALLWPDRLAAEGVFREPHTFQCNANII